jgi:hypothetical protein
LLTADCPNSVRALAGWKSGAQGAIDSLVRSDPAKGFARMGLFGDLSDRGKVSGR